MNVDAISSVAVLLILVTALFGAILLVLLVLAIALLLLLPTWLVRLALLVLLPLLVLLLLLLLVSLWLILLILLRSHYVHPVELLMCAVEMRPSSDAYCVPAKRICHVHMSHAYAPGSQGLLFQARTSHIDEPKATRVSLIVEQKRKPIENVVSCIAQALLSSWHLIHRRTALGVSVATLPIPHHDAQVAVHSPRVPRSPSDLRLSEPDLPGGHC